MNKAIDELNCSLITNQPAYRMTHGCYRQGVRIPLMIPQGAGVSDPWAGRKGSDQEERVLDTGAEPGGSPSISIAVHVYDGPKGQGYEVEGRIELEGSFWQRVSHTGVEPWREKEWTEFEGGGEGWQPIQD